MPFKNRLLYLAWFFFFCSLPWFKAFANVAEGALVVLSFWPGTFSGFKHSVWQNKAVAAITLIFAIYALGMLTTQDLASGFKILKHQHRFLVIPVLFLIHAGFLRQNFNRLLLAFILAAAGAAAFAVLLYLLPEDLVRRLANGTSLMLPYPENYNRSAFGLYSPFIDRLQFSSLLGLGILSSLYLWLAGYKRFLILAALPLLIFTVIIMGGRGAQVALFGSLLIYALTYGSVILFPRLQKRFGTLGSLLVLSVGGLVLFAGIPYVSFKTLKPVQERVNQTRWELEMIETGQYKNYDYNHFTTLRRIVSYQNMGEIIRENPLLGVGTGDYQAEMDKKYAQNNPDIQVNTHNQFLYFWAISGILGLLIFLAVIAFWLNSLKHTGPLFFFALAFISFYFIEMLSDPVLNTQVDGMAFCLFLSLIGLQPLKKERNLFRA